MMKAKEFAAMWNQDQSIEMAKKIGILFIKECAELSKRRSIKSDDAMAAILDEQNKKWKAFARRVDGIRADGFENILKIEFPEAYKLLMRKYGN